MITALNVWEGWLKAGPKAGQWAHANFLNHRALLRAQDIRTQLCRHLRWGVCEPVPAWERMSGWYVLWVACGQGQGMDHTLGMWKGPNEQTCTAWHARTQARQAKQASLEPERLHLAAT